jgi:aryl-alcohol dehydrogenase-like predicted oxidoreductase
VELTTIGGIEVSPIGLGTSRLASLGAHKSRRDAAHLLDAAVDLGVTLIDTADTYGSTTCERWLGEVMQQRSHRFVVATKCGLPTAELPRPLRLLNQPAKKVLQRVGQKHYLDPIHVMRSIEASLRRLRREQIEIYFLHSPPPGVEQMDELFDVLDKARAAGKIGMYGVSSEDPRIIHAVANVRRCGVAQTAINPLAPDALLPLLRPATGANKIEFIANRVLDRRMLLSSAARQGSPPTAAGLAQKLHALSTQRCLSKAHLLIRHASALPQVRVVLTGTTNAAHLAENVAALALPLTPEDLLA